MKITRVISRETSCYEQHKPIVIELHPGHLVLRLKGTRQRLSVSYSTIYWSAARTEAERRRAEKLIPRRKNRIK